MLPSERYEHWLRRALWAALILAACYVLFWLIRFVCRVTFDVLEQRRPPPEACLFRQGRG